MVGGPQSARAKAVQQKVVPPDLQLPQRAPLVKAKRYPCWDLPLQVPWASASSKEPHWLAVSMQENRATLR